MFPEYVKIQDAHDVVFIVLISVIQQFQQFELDRSLMLESSFVSYDFNGYHRLHAVIETFDSLTEGPCAESV